MLKIKQSALATSAVRASQYPEERLPEIALFGRSNAGKSSLINTLINRKNLARTSSEPGKTRLLNFYRISGSIELPPAEDAAAGQLPVSWYFVDLPGYGYAKVARSERDQWLRMMKEYLEKSNVQCCWQLVDIRHAPSEQDIAMHRWLNNCGFEVVVVANKIDKVSRNARASSLSVIAKDMEIPRQSIVSFSAVTREGSVPLLQLTEELLLDCTGQAEAE